MIEAATATQSMREPRKSHLQIYLSLNPLFHRRRLPWQPGKARTLSVRTNKRVSSKESRGAAFIFITWSHYKHLSGAVLKENRILRRSAGLDLLEPPGKTMDKGSALQRLNEL